MRNRIWTELTQAKHNLEFVSLYAQRQRKYLRYFNTGVLVFSTGGIMGWKIWDGIPAIACIIISVVSLIRQVQPQLIMNEKQLFSLENTTKFYSNYLNNLERLWYDSENKAITATEVKDKFFEIKKSEEEVFTPLIETIRTKPKSLVALADKYSRDYFKNTYNTAI